MGSLGRCALLDWKFRQLPANAEVLFASNLARCNPISQANRAFNAVGGRATCRMRSLHGNHEGTIMATSKQKAAARRNIKKAAAAAKRKKTIAHLPKKTRTALGKQGAKMAKRRRG
jgi:hypothetical protein